MSFANRHNKGKQFTNVPDYGESPVFKTLKDLFTANGEAAKYRFHGYYVNTKGNYGDAPAAYLDSCICNFPTHMLADMKEFTEEDLNDINAGKVGFTIETYEKIMKNGSKKTCYGVNWVDM